MKTILKAILIGYVGIAFAYGDYVPYGSDYGSSAYRERQENNRLQQEEQAQHNRQVERLMQENNRLQEKQTQLQQLNNLYQQIPVR